MKWITILFAVLMSMTLVSGSYYSFSDELSWWEFDSPESNSTFALDSKEINNGTVTGAVNNSVGYYNESYEFSTDYIDLAEFHFEDDEPWSVSFWEKHLVSGNNQVIGRNGYADDINIYGNAFRFRQHDATSVTFTISPINQINVWEHWVIVADSGNMTVYRDAIKKDSRLVNSTFYINTIGRGSGKYFNGSIDEIKIYNKSSTLSEVKELYSCRTPNNGTGTWTMLANCTVSNETDTFNQTFIATAGTYIADNTTLIIPKAIAEGGKLVATNGGKIIAGT